MFEKILSMASWAEDFAKASTAHFNQNIWRAKLNAGQEQQQPNKSAKQWTVIHTEPAPRW